MLKRFIYLFYVISRKLISILYNRKRSHMIYPIIIFLSKVNHCFLWGVYCVVSNTTGCFSIPVWLLSHRKLKASELAWPEHGYRWDGEERKWGTQQDSTLEVWHFINNGFKPNGFTLGISPDDCMNNVLSCSCRFVYEQLLGC